MLSPFRLPFYDEYGLKIGALLTDKGREYCGRLDSHLYEIYLGAQGGGIKSSQDKDRI